MSVTEISIAKDFSTTPGIRHRSQGDKSGQEFREDLLIPAYDTSDKVVVILDGTSGYASSFLEEVFGGLAREKNNKNVLDRIEIISNEEEYLIDEIHEYVQNAY